jgi:hypothetical protein
LTWAAEELSDVTAGASTTESAKVCETTKPAVSLAVTVTVAGDPAGVRVRAVPVST